MKRPRTAGTFLTCFLFGAGLVCAGAPYQDQPAQPDNTKVNKRDRSKTEPTADQQKENKTDRELARQIRREIVKDKTLSTYAHNVKIIAQNGTVTLKGPVRSAEESQTIETVAAKAAGAGNVKNELSVKSDTADRSKPKK